MVAGQISLKALFVLGTDKSQFPVNKLTNKNYAVITEGGGHHFEDHADNVVAQVLAHIK